MAHKPRHAAPKETLGQLRRMAAAVLTTGALVSLGSSPAFADVLHGTPYSGDENTDQQGEQNLNCGNSARLLRVNVAETDDKVKKCVDTDGHTRRHSGNGARAIGDTTLGPQLNTAQAGKQNLNCGNSADVITVNVLGTINRETTCVAVDDDRDGHKGHGGGQAYTGNARTLGGTSLGQQVNTAQVGKQNLNCGNASDTLTVNVLGTVRKRTTCIAADHSHDGSASAHRGKASADAGQVAGTETNTAQNGRQNQTCGNPGGGIDVPLGQIKRHTQCTVDDGSLPPGH
ncbi:hypothetical protein [Streptomyces purpureus]|uniref:hypothetical protein n=1 Tax=Streptomyces purpureus TaxID=1951 RepID=UPI0003829887|nr:hypothetical protein [Streptomyces purpureus]